MADELLTATLRHKLRQAGLADAGAAVRFDPAHITAAKRKLFHQTHPTELAVKTT